MNSEPAGPTTSDHVRAITKSRRLLRAAAKAFHLAAGTATTYELAQMHSDLGRRITEIATTEQELRTKP